MTIEVVPNDLHRAAREMASGADQVGRADPSSRVADISRAMPGSASAEQVPDLEEKLEKRFKYWKRDAMKLHDGYIAAADDYVATDARIRAQAEKSRRELDRIHGG